MAAVNGTARAISLNPGQVSEIRRALILGLQALGEVERLCDARDVCETLKEPYPSRLTPLHVSVESASFGVFADALAYLEHYETATDNG